MTAEIVALYDSGHVANRTHNSKGGMMGQTLEKQVGSDTPSPTTNPETQSRTEVSVGIGVVRSAGDQLGERIIAFTDKFAADIGAQVTNKAP